MVKKVLLPVSVGFALAVLGLVCVTIGKGVEYVILTVPFLAVLMVRLVIEVVTLTETVNKNIMSVITATSSDLTDMRQYVDDEIHEVYLTMASERYDED